MINTESGENWPIEELEILIDRRAATELQVYSNVDGVEVWRAVLDTAGRVAPAGTDLLIQESNGQEMLFATFLEHHPFTIFYGAGESSIGQIRFQARSDYPDLPDNILVPWPFEDVDMLAEVKNERDGLITIKNYAIKYLSDNPMTNYIIDDDRSGEVADLVTIGYTETGVVTIGLYHCKASSEDYSGARVEDLYEVLGQAERSVRWLDIRRISKRLLGRISSGSVVVYGRHEDLSNLLANWIDDAVQARFAICVVQPGFVVSRANTVQNAKILLNDALEWISQHDANFMIAGR